MKYGDVLRLEEKENLHVEREWKAFFPSSTTTLNTPLSKTFFNQLWSTLAAPCGYECVYECVLQCEHLAWLHQHACWLNIQRIFTPKKLKRKK